MTQHWLSHATNESYVCGASAIGRRRTEDRDPNLTTCRKCRVWPNGDAPRDPNYTDPALLDGVKLTDNPRYGRPVSGYGPKMPTRYKILYSELWRRVYVMQYGNAGSAYVVVKGKEVFLDGAVEARIEAYARLKDELGAQVAAVVG